MKPKEFFIFILLIISTYAIEEDIFNYVNFKYAGMFYTFIIYKKDFLIYFITFKKKIPTIFTHFYVNN